MPTSVHKNEIILDSDENGNTRKHMIGPYMLGDIIGEGSFAKVKDAIHVETLKRYAIKVFHIEKIKKIPNGLESVDSEIYLLRKLRHKNILVFYKSLYSPNNAKICLIYELCATSLQMLIDSAPNNKIPQFQAQSYFRQTFEGIKYIHSRWTIHLDIKPANLMLKFDSTLKIGDFGAAQEVDMNLDGTWKAVKSGGSPAFQPPEVIGDGNIENPFAIDIWGLGVTLFYLVLGEHPFMGENVFIICNNIISGSYSFPHTMGVEDANFVTLVKTMLQSDPVHRATLADVSQSKWLRSKLSRLQQEIPLPPNSDFNPFFDTTTLGRLEDMYITGTDEREAQPLRMARKASRFTSMCSLS